MRVVDAVKLAGTRTETEASFEATFGEYLDLCGWRWYHTRRSSGSRRGFPDVAAVRERFVMAELKRSHDERPDAEQLAWLNDLARSGVETHVLTPSDWNEITVIFGPPRPPVFPSPALRWVVLKCPKCKRKRLFRFYDLGRPKSLYHCNCCMEGVMRDITEDHK